MKNIVIGTGAGRDGTKSLAALLSMQIDWYVTHEAEALKIEWNDTIKPAKAAKKIVNELNSRKTLLTGDVAFYHTRYAAELIKQFNVRVICMHRKVDDVVESYLKWWYIGDDLWNEDGVGNEYWRAFYPKYKCEKRDDGIRQWAIEQYARHTRLKAEFPDNVLIMQTEHLNNEAEITKLLSFIGIPKEKQRPFPGIKLNVSDNSSYEDYLQTIES